MSKLLLVGTANCGKTTLFNTLTGSRYKTVNYPGATVEIAKGSLRSPLQDIEVIDTPGISSLYPTSLDEEVTLRLLYSDEYRGFPVLCLADANQLSRHLNLCRQLIQAGFQTTLILTLIDELESRGQSIDIEALSAELNIPVLAIDPRRSETKRQILELEDFLRNISQPQHPHPFDSQRAQYEVQANQNLAQKVTQLHSLVQRKADLDRWFLHPFWGVIIFFGLMLVLFSSIYWLATPFIDGIDFAFGFAMQQLSSILPDHFITRLFIEGLIGGLGAVLVFLPQILILFLMMGLLEDSGYLSRGAAIVDKPLSKMGLNGKSFVPLLSGFACAIPAMMATRTLSHRRERFATLFIIPLMSCSARLPVYALIIHFFLADQNPLWGGLFLTGLYLTSLLIGGIAAGILAKWTGKKDQGEFLLELPTLRLPQPKIIAVQTYHRAKSYLRRAGPTIVVISLLLWAVTHMPWDPQKSEAEIVQNSWAGQMGRVFEPLTETMGLDWRGGIALVSGFAAREVFVSSLALVYQTGENELSDDNLDGIIQAMTTATFSDGRPVFTSATAWAILVFYLIALQCFPTVAVARKEFGSDRWALTQLMSFLIAGWGFASLTHLLIR